ncbi:hypothetical protein [Halococcus sp. IIIV-5B]|uniref:hypothetical protein n=1 Tax=Halococcus sp. IIIV-5B TaxID=2321230 RepID=UPI0013142906|nr:hypothetical protein [Halococcus sp. IIIV-5B]
MPIEPPVDIALVHVVKPIRIGGVPSDIQSAPARLANAIGELNTKLAGSENRIEGSILDERLLVEKQLP